MDSFCLVLELHRRGFATDGATPSSSKAICIAKKRKNLFLKQYSLLKWLNPFVNMPKQMFLNTDYKGNIIITAKTVNAV